MTSSVTNAKPIEKNLVLVEGDDYNASDNRALRFESSEWGATLTGATITLRVADITVTPNVSTDFSGSVVTGGTTGTQIVVVSLTSANTDALSTTTTPETFTHKYELRAVLATSSRVVMLAKGYITVQPKLGAP